MQTQPDDRFGVFESSTHQASVIKSGYFWLYRMPGLIANLLSIKIARQKVFQLIALSLVTHSSM
jgi:hypothetical protein